jgi:protein PsiE
MNGKLPRYIKLALAFVAHVGLLVIAIATVIAASGEVMAMIKAGSVTLADLLMLFLYLEVLTMVGLYYGSGKLPVRFPLYIAIVALARYLILDMQEMNEWHMLAVSGAILLLTLSVLLIRYGHLRFPYPGDDAIAELRATKDRNE